MMKATRMTTVKKIVMKNNKYKQAKLLSILYSHRDNKINKIASYRKTKQMLLQLLV